MTDSGDASEVSGDTSEVSGDPLENSEALMRKAARYKYTLTAQGVTHTHRVFLMVEPPRGEEWG